MHNFFHAEANLDCVDALIVAIAERLNTNRFLRRDFQF